MSIYTRMLVHTAVYWRKEGVGRDGKPTYADPDEVDCRWEDKAEQFVSANNRTEVSKAVVYVDPDVVVSPGDALLLGTLADLDDEADPFGNSQAWEVRAVGRLDNIRGTKTLQTVWL